MNKQYVVLIKRLFGDHIEKINENRVYFENFNKSFELNF